MTQKVWDERSISLLTLDLFQLRSTNARAQHFDKHLSVGADSILLHHLEVQVKQFKRSVELSKDGGNHFFLIPFNIIYFFVYLKIIIPIHNSHMLYVVKINPFILYYYSSITLYFRHHFRSNL